MALQSGLAVWCYTSPSTTAYPFIAREYARALDSLTFSTTSPGGFADLSATLYVPDATVPRPELSLFSRVAVMAGPVCVWLGELADPAVGMDDRGEYVKLTALGVGNGLRDDPQHISYTAQTLQAMAIVALQSVTTGASANELPTISSDTSALFPDNPAGTLSPSYDGRNVEEIISDLVTIGGDYAWGTWAHPTQRDTAGFPLGQLLVHARDAATMAYVAYLAAHDVTQYEVNPSAERAYNAIEVTYRPTGVTNAAASATYSDSRMGANRGQGAMPFRFRKLLRDVSSTTTIGQAQAQAIANTYGAQFQNVTNKVTATLRGLRDANGVPIPLYMAQADKNLAIPDIAQRGATLATTPTAGVNLFYLVKTTYAEDSSGDAHLDVEGDNFFDTGNLQIARLQLQADTGARSARTTGSVQALGAPETGYCGGYFNNVASLQNVGQGVNFKSSLYQAPASITLTPFDVNASLAVSNGPFVTAFSAYGFAMYWQAAAGVTTHWYGTYVTAGN